MMGKKGFLSLEYTLALIILSILLILVIVAFLGPKLGLFNYFSNYVSTAKKWLSGKESIQVSELRSPEKFDKFFDSFIATLESAVGTAEKCLIKYEKFDDFEGFVVELSNSGKNLALRKINTKDQAITQDEIKGINFCLIEPNAFYDNYLKGAKCNKNCKTDFTDIISMTFTANKLNDEFGLEDGGLMYKPKNDKVCFIPTHKTGVTWYRPWEIFTKWGCNPNENTIDDDCIKNIEKNIGIC